MITLTKQEIEFTKNQGDYVMYIITVDVDDIHYILSTSRIEFKTIHRQFNFSLN
jgi:hypothetical protein